MSSHKANNNDKRCVITRCCLDTVRCHSQQFKCHKMSACNIMREAGRSYPWTAFLFAKITFRRCLFPYGPNSATRAADVKTGRQIWHKILFLCEEWIHLCIFMDTHLHDIYTQLLSCIILLVFFYKDTLK